MRIRSLCVALILITLLDARSVTGQETVADYVEAIENAQNPNRQGLDGYTLEELMEEFGVPGVSVAVIHDFAIHWAKAYGVADVETGAPVDVETMFQAASISKPI